VTPSHQQTSTSGSLPFTFNVISPLSDSTVDSLSPRPFTINCSTSDFPTPLTTHHHDSPCTPYLPFLDRLCCPRYRGRIPITVNLRRLHSSVSSGLEVHVLYEFIQNLRVLVVHRCLLLIDKVRVKVKTYLCVRNSVFGKELCHLMSRDTRDSGPRPHTRLSGGRGWTSNTPCHLHKVPSFCNIFFIMNR
jgi:hypothetical protein